MSALHATAAGSAFQTNDMPTRNTGESANFDLSDRRARFLKLEEGREAGSHSNSGTLFLSSRLGNVLILANLQTHLDIRILPHLRSRAPRTRPSAQRATYASLIRNSKNTTQRPVHVCSPKTHASIAVVRILRCQKTERLQLHNSFADTQVCGRNHQSTWIPCVKMMEAHRRQLWNH